MLKTVYVVQVPSEMLQPIMKSKYPDITEEEQAISIPLQVPRLRKKTGYISCGKYGVYGVGVVEAVTP